jgi:DNA excision repair protein ERCC-2
VKLDLINRKATLSVRALAEFQTGPAAPFSRRALKRAQLGSEWHNTLREATAQILPEAKFEVPISATFQHGNWVITLEGRVDQWIPEEGRVRLIEVKTVGFNLPVSPQFLNQRYPEYLCQAVAYGYLLRRDPSFQDCEVQCELLWVDYKSGNTQTMVLSLADEGLLYTQIEALCDFLENDYRQKIRFKAVPMEPPYPFRPEQERLWTELDAWGKQAAPAVGFLQAPTGFGKTGVCLYWGLQQLQTERYDRLVFITHKTSGAQAALRELERMGSDREGLCIHPFRSKEAHRIQSPLHTCDPWGLECHHGLQERWREANFKIEEGFEGGVFSLNKTKLLGGRYGICPYALSKTALKLANVWICDANYIFSSAHEGVLMQQPGFDPQRTLLLVDEAHHLPQRVAHAFSQWHTYEQALQLQQALSLGDVPAGVLALWAAWVRFLETLEPCEKLEEGLVDVLFHLSQSLQEVLQAFLMGDADLPAEIRMHLWQAIDVHDFMLDERFEKLCYVPAPGQLALICLDAKRLIRKKLEGFGKSLLMSATLAPMETFAQSCGLKPYKVENFEGESPWKAGAYDVVIDMRLDTRYRLRPHSYHLTAETLMWMKAASDGPVVGFFPSYAYAEAVAQALVHLSQKESLYMQPMGQGATADALEKALLANQIVLLVLGSSFAESINALGGRVSHALIAGLGLPAPTPIEKAQGELWQPQGEGLAFYHVYQIPAMRKVNQALGRFVRQPGQSIKILLHCQRFQQKAYQKLLHKDYQTECALTRSESIKEWIFCEK